MTAKEIRQTFLAFFKEKGHTIVPSAPLVVKNDPTLLFINAGMNQFKDWFLGNTPILYPRVADSQKCLRVSGKHNDLEEVGHDTYHHTLFEMLGNWSFGDYFKKEAIAWAWELLHDVFHLDADRMYATVFEGSTADDLTTDTEAYDYWKAFMPADHILMGSKKDNFWEMGDTGPCGPCSEIHIDLRSAQERAEVSGASLVNTGHPLVIEIWNLVFIQYNRKANGSLESLPLKHVDTGMGLERLCMAIQGKTSNYDTDIFQNLIGAISQLCGKPYGQDPKTDIAMRVIADHLRAISFSIADGQLPSNVKAGYVIRRILRRAVRYGYTFLGLDKPFICRLVPALIQEMGEAYPELVHQQALVENVIFQEEEAFLRALDKGIRLFEEFAKEAAHNEFSGKDAFLLYDTYGFPLDLTVLMASEKGMTVNIGEFNVELAAQKDRARRASATKEGDWVDVRPFTQCTFLGYNQTQADARIMRYRKVNTKGGDVYQIVLDQTPFYAESGGQVGDTGVLENEQGERLTIINTIKENNLALHVSKTIFTDPGAECQATVDTLRRQNIANNHTTTHLLHYALRQVLGTHIEQKGSMVSADGFRFDFSHFAKIEPADLRKVEQIVNQMIRDNIAQDTKYDVPIDQARAMGAMALFGEKYGQAVRVVRFGPSVELCGGTHTRSTGTIGLCKILSEGAIAAGVRRIEAITGSAVEQLMYKMEDMVSNAKMLLNDHPDLVAAVQRMVKENEDLRKSVADSMMERAAMMQKTLWEQRTELNGIRFVVFKGPGMPELIKDIAFAFKDAAHYPSTAFIAAYTNNNKPNLTLMLSQDLVDSGLNAGDIIRTAAKQIQGGGGGQSFYATAGGKNVEGLMAAVDVIQHTIITQ